MLFRSLKLRGNVTNPCRADFRGYATDVLRGNVRSLHETGATVAVVTAATSAFPFSARAWFENNKCSNEIIRAVARSEPGAQLIDLAKWMCPDPLAGCVNEQQGVRMRTDLVHYRARAAEVVVQWMMEQLPRR